MKVLAFALNFVLITVCLMPIEQSVPMPFTRSDLIFHALAYCGVTWLFIFAGFKRIKASSALFTQGVAIEIIQPYFSRHFEFYDIFANSLGVIVALLFFIIKDAITKKVDGST